MIITASDQRFLLALCESYRKRGTVNTAVLYSFKRRLEKATLVASGEVPPEVVTINSTVLLYEYSRGLQVSVTLVLPWEEDIVYRRISVFSRTGSSLLGQRIGEVVVCPHPKRVLLMRIDGLSRREVLPRQPAALGSR